MAIKWLNVVFLLMLISVVSCANENIPVLNDVEEDVFQTVGDEWSVYENDIINIIDKIGSPIKSRTQNYSVSYIVDSNGKPCVYVVNFGECDGYLLISATKKFDPVLAFSYTGHYNVGTNKPAGLICWENEICEAIETVNELSADSLLKISKLWKFYLASEEENSVKDSIPNAKSKSMGSYEFGDVMDAYLVMCSNLRSQGYEILEMSNLSEQENTIVKEYVDAMTYPDYEDIRYQICIVASKTENRSTFIDNFVKTTWEQQSGFNSAFPYRNGKQISVGCGTIAAGQIMRYYEHTTKFNWVDMPLNKATTETSEFLFDLAYCTNPGIYWGDTSTNIKNMNESFRVFGYKSECKELSEDLVYNNLKNKKPVYLDGVSGSGTGHAWIASGYKQDLFMSKKQLFVIAWPNKYDSVLTFGEESVSDYPYVYYIWGYNDGCDGFYKLSHCMAGTGKEYSKQRMMICNIEPIK